jgi:rubredoxin
MFHRLIITQKERKKMRYKCDVCEWIFDEEKEGIKFEDLADDWTCPICGAAKDMFSKID